MAYDLLIKGGTLIDPARNIHANKDVAFSNGVVAAVDDNLSKIDAQEVLDASGCLVTPGMIDLHVHVFYGVSHFGIERTRPAWQREPRQWLMPARRVLTFFPDFAST